MAYKDSLQRYRNWYAKLLRLYPKPYRDRFGEGMEQTFHDLCTERVENERGVFDFVIWTFLETSVEIIKKNITFTIMHNKNIVRIALVTLCILLIPLIGMQLSDQWNWTLSDFIIAGVLLFGTGLAYELISRKAKNVSYRIAAAIGVLTGLILIWINGAVGIIGNENNPANLLYGGVLLVGAIGALIARFRPRGMSIALFATAVAQFLVPVIALMIFKPDFDPGVIQVFILNFGFVVLFAVSALLFRRSIHKQEGPGSEQTI